jgi:bacillolysin
MSKFTFGIILFFLGISFVGNAQNILKDDVAYQKTLKFDNAIAKKDALNSFSKLYNLEAANTFVAKTETSDESGLVHQRHQQFYKGIMVEFGTAITHSQNGNVLLINGELYNPKNLDLKASFDSQIGFQKALMAVNAQKFLWEDAVQARLVDYKKPSGELVIFPLVKTGEVRLAYKYDIYATEPISRQEVYVDAHSGEILFKNPIIKHANKLVSNAEVNQVSKAMDAFVTATASTKYSGSRNIETSLDNTLAKYVLLENSRGTGNGIVTYNCERLVNQYQNVHFQDNDNNWTSAEHANTFKDDAALDAHWGAEKTYDFWKNVFNRNSYDNAGAQIRSYVHFQRTATSLSNAFWNGSFMTYGDGASGASGKPFTSIDICGHEIGHAVCTYTANLAYQNQSGAMNEGFSDIWGACIEQYGRNGTIAGTPPAAASNIWKVGEDITTGGLRSMSSPNTKGDPDTFKGTNWIATGDEGSCTPTGGTGGNDYCGVHTNSGVLNHWFFILTTGKSGTNNAPIAERDTYSVTGIGMDKSAQIAYYAERDYLTANSTYFDARDATLNVVTSLYCPNSPETIAVTNAWFAVNVGNSFVSYAADVALKPIVAASSVSCSVTTFSPTVTFFNNGTNALSSVAVSYRIDSGAISNETWTGNLAVCTSQNYPISVSTSGLSVGRHTLTITTNTAGDGNASNNSKVISFFVNAGATANAINTFESDSDNLIAFNEIGLYNVWERGYSNKAVLDANVAGSSQVYGTFLAGSYLDNSKGLLVSKCYNLASIVNPIMKFDMAFDLENDFDVLYMQYSIDGGVNWSRLGAATDANWYTSSNSSCETCVGGQWTGEAGLTNGGLANGVKRQYSYNLSQFAYGSAAPQSNIIFRFVFESDGGQVNDGAIIDNFVIEGTLSSSDFEYNDINIYPNPTNGTLNVFLNSQFEDKTTLTMYDIQGRNILSKEMSGVSELLNLNNFQEGVYYLMIRNGDRKTTKKVVLKK